MGGKWNTTQFQDKPDAIFDAWMYQTPDNYEPRTFTREEFADRQIQKINGCYAPFLKDKTHAL